MEVGRNLRICSKYSPSCVKLILQLLSRKVKFQGHMVSVNLCIMNARSFQWRCWKSVFIVWQLASEYPSNKTHACVFHIVYRYMVFVDTLCVVAASLPVCFIECCCWDCVDVLFIVGPRADSAGSDRPERSWWWRFGCWRRSNPCCPPKLCYWRIDMNLLYSTLYTSIQIRNTDGV